MKSANELISPLHRDEVGRAADLLAAALHDDPGWRHVVPDPAARQTALRGITKVALRDGLSYGGVLAARQADRLCGVAVWMPPGSFPMSRHRRMRSLPAMVSLATRVRGDIRDLARFGASIEAAFPLEPVWYLQVLGVHPAARGQGLGRHLLQPILTLADRTGAACYLETARPRNKAYYEAVGFRISSPAAQLVPGGPCMIRMVRPAAGRTP